MSEALIVQAYDSGSPALAASLASRHLRRDPRNPVALLCLAQASGDLGRYDQAREAYDRYAEVVGAYSSALCRQRALLEDTSGQIQAAEGWYRRGIDLDPDDARGYIFLGSLYARLGRLDQAVAIHRRGTQCSQGPLDEAWLNLGLVLRALGEYGAATECFDAALAVTPDYSEARRARVDAMQASSLHDEA